MHWIFNHIIALSSASLSLAAAAVLVYGYMSLLASVGRDWDENLDDSLD